MVERGGPWGLLMGALLGLALLTGLALADLHVRPAWAGPWDPVAADAASPPAAPPP